MKTCKAGLHQYEGKQCKECQKAAARSWRQANADKRREADRRRVRDPEKVREKTRRWRQANPDKDKERNRRWVKANPEKVREKTRRWMRSTDREALNAFLEAFTTSGGRIGTKDLYAEWVRFASVQLAEAGSQGSFTIAVRRLRPEVGLRDDCLIKISMKEKEVPF